MANTHVYFRELRIILEEELTQVYVYMDAYVDVPLGIQGWHHKTFPKSKSAVDIINTFGEDDPMLWPQEAPPTNKTER